MQDQEVALSWEDWSEEELLSGDYWGQMACTESSCGTTTVSVCSSSQDSIALMSPDECKKRKRYELSEQAKERRRERRRVRFPVPKIPKQDLRRQFAPMLTNIFNSFDLPLFQSFYSTFCVHNCMLEDINPDNYLFNFPAHVQANGLGGFTTYIAECLLFMPDAIFELTNTKIKVVDMISSKAGTSSKTLKRHRTEQTKHCLQEEEEDLTRHLSHHQDDEEDEDEDDDLESRCYERQHSHSILSGHMKYEGQLLFQALTLVDSLEAVRVIDPQEQFELDRFNSRVKLIDNPVHVTFVGQMQIHINSLMQITKMEFRGL